MTDALDLAQERRIDNELDALLEEKLEGVSLAAVSPAARVKLRNILKKYAKSPHPFRDCVKDNMKRFGPGRTEALCASLKDTIRGTTKWRKGGGHKLSDAELEIDGQVLVALDHISEVDLGQIFLKARALEEHQTESAIPLLETTGSQELMTWGSPSNV